MSLQIPEKPTPTPRPRTAQALSLPAPFASSSRSLVEPATMDGVLPYGQQSFHDAQGFNVYSSSRPSFSLYHNSLGSDYKGDNCLKRTLGKMTRSLKLRNSRKIARIESYDVDAVGVNTRGLPSRKSPSRQLNRQVWSSKAQSSVASHTKLNFDLVTDPNHTASAMSYADCSSLACLSASESVHQMRPHPFPAGAGAAARAAAAASTRTMRPVLADLLTDDATIKTEDYCFGERYDTPNSMITLEHRRDDSIHDLSDDYECMDVDIELIKDIDHVETLPNLATIFPFEITTLIISQLDQKTINACRGVSREWKAIAEDRSIWQRQFLQEYTPPPSHKSSYLKMGGLGLGRPLRSIPQDFRLMALARQQLTRNWRNSLARATYFCGHTDSVYCCQFDEDKIISGSRDRTIRVWDMKTKKCLRVIGAPHNKPSAHPPQLPMHLNTIANVASVNGTDEGDAIFHSPPFFHQQSILCLQYDHEIMVTGSSDMTCIIWNVKTFEPLKVLEHHKAGVLDICFDDKYIISCSKDHTICVWSRSTWELVTVLVGHTGPVNAVQMRGNMLVSASGDGNAKLWNLLTKQNIRTFPSKDRGLAAVEFTDDGQFVLAGGNDQVIYKFDAQTGELVHTYTGHNNLVRSLFLDCNNGRVLSGSYDQGMRIYDFNNGKQLCRFDNWTTSWILAAKSDYRRIVATSQDGRVLMMDFGHDVANVDMLLPS